ncbi:hypothetical protein ETC03_12240 [Geobacillus sp. MMMUD3]|nr:hypothetical protein [Geobacillus sp. MMMUD3]
MYKSKEELMEMDVKGILDYVEWLEKNDAGAIENSFEYQDWCMGPLMDALDEMDGWDAFEERFGK